MKPISCLLVLACLVGVVIADQPAEKLDFSILIAPPPKAATAEELAPLDWSIMPGDVDAKTGNTIEFSLFGEVAKSAEVKPVVFVYTGDLRTCAPCRTALSEIKSLTKEQQAELPFRIVPRGEPQYKLPQWVRATPTIHWAEPDGVSRQMQGWPGLDALAKRWEESFHRAELRAEKKQ